MKRIFLAIVALMISMTFKSYPSTEESIFISLTQSNFRHKEDIPGKGKRTPGKAETCIIDFNLTSIQTSLSDEINYYELWDQEGEYMVASVACDSDMVAFLSTVSGVYQFRIATAETIYIGYIEL